MSNKKQTALTLLRNRLITDSSMYPQYKEYINGIVDEIDNELLMKEKEQTNKNSFDENKAMFRLCVFLIILIGIMAFTPLILLLTH